MTLSDNMVFTIKNKLTVNQITYKVCKSRRNFKLFWISVLIKYVEGEEYVYIGRVNDMKYEHAGNLKLSHITVITAKWYFEKLKTESLPANISTIPGRIFDAKGNQRLQRKLNELL